MGHPYVESLVATRADPNSEPAQWEAVEHMQRQVLLAGVPTSRWVLGEVTWEPAADAVSNPSDGERWWRFRLHYTHF
jgi:hypothetical protein